MRPCALMAYPPISLVHFETTEIDTLVITKYESSYGFDSVVEIKQVLPLKHSFHTQGKDSFSITPFLYDYVQVNFGASSKYNYQIEFGNARNLKLSNFIYHCEEVDVREHSISSGGCYCEFVGCKVETVNCSYAISDKSIFVMP